LPGATTRLATRQKRAINIARRAAAIEDGKAPGIGFFHYLRPTLL
jgi:hypothetical protein